LVPSCGLAGAGVVVPAGPMAALDARVARLVSRL